MPISFNNYINITSSVGGDSDVPERKLTLRVFDDNSLIPTNGFVTFTNASDVGDYFGTNSEEYQRALFYFGWVSKIGTQPPSIDYARWNASATAPQIFGTKGPQALATWNAITTGAFSITLGATTHAFSALDFSGAANLAAVAAIIQAAIRTYSAGGAMFTATTVTYDATAQRFDLTGGVTGVAIVSVAAGGGGNDIAAQLGWLSPTTILSFGAAGQTPVQAVTALTQIDNNFGSFLFMGTPTEQQIIDVANWNATENNMFLYTVGVSAANAATYSAALIAIAGVTMTLSIAAGEYPEQVPAMIAAATDYLARNSVQSYDYQPNFSLTPSVSNDASFATYTALRINFYGVTQTAGRFLAFYQPGKLMGGSNTPTDLNVYVNEMWFKDAAGAALMGLLLALPQIPANNTGRAQILSVLQGVINQALLNGTIEVGKALDSTQKAFITTITGDPNAWQQVFNIGYWVDVVIVKDDSGNYIAKYTLIYSKDDTISKINGRDILI